MPRAIKNESWISAYLRYTAFQESPSLYHLWTAIFILASTLKRNVFFDRGFYVLFTNLYVGLIGPSAVVSKTTATDIGIDLWLDTIPDGELMKEKITPWAIYDRLGILTTRFGHSCATIYAPEMRTFINASYREEIVTLLTSYYGCPKSAPYETKSGGKINIENVCLNIVACSTPEWLMTGLSGSDIGGGFTGRWIYVYRDRTTRNAPCPEDGITPEWEALKLKLAIDLFEISTIQGQFKFSDSAKMMYKSWYRGRKKEWVDERLFGYYGRKRDTVLKIAMILAIAEPSFRDFTLTIEHLKAAFDLLKHVEKDMGNAFSGVTFSESTKMLDRVLRQINNEFGKTKQKVKFSKLARMNQHYVNAAELDQVLESLIKMDHIDYGTDNKGKKVYWPI